ncbi:jg18715, partial [Pararge aegeria aegeria]
HRKEVVSNSQKSSMNVISVSGLCGDVFSRRRQHIAKDISRAAQLTSLQELLSS